MPLFDRPARARALRSRLASAIPASVQARLAWLALVALPIVVAACNKSGGGSGY